MKKMYKTLTKLIKEEREKVYNRVCDQAYSKGYLKGLREAKQIVYENQPVFVRLK